MGYTTPVDRSATMDETLEELRIDFVCVSSIIMLCTCKSNSQRYNKIYLMSLTHARAETRSKWIRQNSIEYDFHIILNQGTEFHGLAEISFYLETPNIQSLPLDFSCKKVHLLQVNQQIVEADVSEDRFLLIHNKIYHGKNLLHRGKNRVTIIYSGDYDTSGEGCVTYTETSDTGKTSQYLYTQFEAYAANMVFPCFDQPDLKAPMKLSVIAPSIWKILSNEHPQSSAKFEQKGYIQHSKLHNHSKHLLPRLFELVPKQLKDNYFSTVFPATKLLPTYLYCFIAGEYEEIKCSLPHELPFELSIYSISSYKPYLQNLSHFIFDVTIQAMKFYEEYFGYPYPFNKFDQVWVHEFKAGAMENAGIVTYNDADLYKQKNPTSVQMIELANTITHELSHHWFGNLVTMKWWDDLWLNESFADYISYFCIEKIKDKLKYKFESAMSIFRDREVWGYKEDLRNTTTHPIRAKVQNTAETHSIFDGITYSKGGACLKQLMCLIGQKQFSISLSNYFHRFQWSNASIDDFLEEMSYNFKETMFTLDEWKQMWLMTASLNVFRVDWEDKKGIISVNIRQGVNHQKYDTLRFRRVQIALFNDKAEIFKKLLVLIHPEAGQAFTQKVDQHVCAVLYNHNDQDYSENIIDSKSLAFFEANLPKISDLLSRTILWYQIRSMAERAAYPITKFTALVDKHIFEEKTDFLFESILCSLRGLIGENLPIKKRHSHYSLIFNHLYCELASGKQHSEQRLNILTNELIAYAYTEAEKTILFDWLEGREAALKVIPLDNTRKWNIGRKVFTLLKLTALQKEDVFNAIAAGDDSDKKKEEAHVFDAIIAHKIRFEELYQKFKVEDKNMSLTVKKLIAVGWRNYVHYDQLVSEYRQKYFNDLIPLSKSMSYPHYQHFYRNLRPIDDELEIQIAKYCEVVKQLQTMQDEKGELKVHAKELKKIIDDLEKKKANYDFNS